MADEIEIKQPKFSDYMYILYKWKKFLIINMLIIIIAATIYSFLLPEQFKATSIVMVANTNANRIAGLGTALSSGGLGGLSGLSGLGTQLLGTTNPSNDLIYEILESRATLTKVINKFDLMAYYGIDDENMDKAIKYFSDDIIFEPTDNGLIEVSVINESPEKSAHMANYFVQLADSVNIVLNVEQAKNNRIFIEKRYFKNIQDLASAEDSMYKFQKLYGIFAVPEQLEASVKATAEIEAQLVEQEMIVDLLKEQYGVNFPSYIEMNNKLDYLRNKVNELKNASDLSFTSNVLFPFAKVPDLTLNYFRFYRDIEIQSKILEFVLPMYEQAKVEEQKSTPSLLVVDKAVPPQLKYSPKKAVIILAAVFLLLIIMVPFIFIGEKAVSREQFQNPLQASEAKFFNKVLKMYRMKF